MAPVLAIIILRHGCRALRKAPPPCALDAARVAVCQRDGDGGYVMPVSPLKLRPIPFYGTVQKSVVAQPLLLEALS